MPKPPSLFIVSNYLSFYIINRALSIFQYFNYNSVLVKLPYMFIQPTNSFKFSSDGNTEDSEMKAPRPKPMEFQEFLPDLNLEEESLSCEFQQKFKLQEKKGGNGQRKGSLDNHFSILGYIDRKIKEKSRQRIMSEEITNMRA